MNLDALARPLSVDEIDFRIQSIFGSGWCLMLAYKDARVDMARLDEAFGPFGWQRDYKMVGTQQMAGVAVKHEGEWVWKWDVGTESNTEKEKGLASDGFKRACFNLGIGRELYDYPLLLIQLNPEEFENKGGKNRQTNKLKLKDWVWASEFEGGKITALAAKDNNGKIRYKWGKFKK